MGKPEPDVKSKNPVNDTEMITTDKKFFWYSVMSDNFDGHGFLENQEINEGLGVDDEARVYEKIQKGDIFFIYEIGKEGRLIGIASCEEKYSEEHELWVDLKGIKLVLGPLWKTIEEDPILHDSEPVKYSASSENKPIVVPEGLYPQQALWSIPFPLTQKEAMRLLELSKVASTYKKFFWFTTKKENWPEPQTLDVFLEKQEESEIWYGKLASAYEEIEAGSIVLIYVPGKDRRLFGIAICVRKGVYENGKPDVILKGIKPVQGPLWKTIVEDPILRNSKPVKMNALGTLFPLTHEEGIHLIELAQVSLKDVSDRNPREYWQISLRGDATMWDEWKKNNIIAIGFKEVIEPVGEKILEMSENEIKKLYPKNPIPEGETDKIINFLQKMKEGHYVLIEQRGSYLGWGIIKSGTIYDPSQEFSVYRQIEWKNTAMQESVTHDNKE